eukprot:507333-Pleurochrysis_carterae.AAC.1
MACIGPVAVRKFVKIELITLVQLALGRLSDINKLARACLVLSLVPHLAVSGAFECLQTVC